MFEELTKKLDSVFDLGVPFFDCIVLKDGKCVYRHKNGYTDLKNKVKVTGKEFYNIYSCSKLITCISALQLVEKGLISLEDKVSKYLPEYENLTVRRGDLILPAKNPLLIKHLFSMTGGLSYDRNLPSIIACQKETRGKCPTREIIRGLATEPLLFEPGELFNYSFCHDVLACVVEVVAKTTFGEYVKRNIFNPLSMKNSTFLLDDKDLDKVVNQYEYFEGKGVVERDKKIDYKFGSEYEAGGAGCISTLEDYVKFLEAVRVGDVIVKKETVDLMATNVLNQKQLESCYVYPLGYGYGLGQRCPINDEKTDFGWGGAAGAFYAIDRQNATTFYFATHVLRHDELHYFRYDLIPLIKKITSNI